jgi:hypothetical protein
LTTYARIRKYASVCVLCATFLICGPVSAQRLSQSQQNKHYVTLHPLLVDTLVYTKLEGVMTGDIANAFNQKLNLQGPVYFKSELTKRLADKDCGHIKVVFTKRGVVTPKGVTDANLRTEMDYCKDGSPPSVKPHTTAG